MPNAVTFLDYPAQRTTARGRGNIDHPSHPHTASDGDCRAWPCSSSPSPPCAASSARPLAGLQALYRDPVMTLDLSSPSYAWNILLEVSQAVVVTPTASPSALCRTRSGWPQRGMSGYVRAMDTRDDEIHFFRALVRIIYFCCCWCVRSGQAE
eukprot:gene23057-biopygen4286